MGGHSPSWPGTKGSPVTRSARLMFANLCGTAAAGQQSTASGKSLPTGVEQEEMVNPRQAGTYDTLFRDLSTAYDTLCTRFPTFSFFFLKIY